MGEVITTIDLSPRNLDEAMRFADLLSKSDIVPKDFQNKPGNILVAIQWGMELGLKPMQAMQNIAVINGRPSLWGDAVLALVRSSPLCEYVYETDDGKEATCKVKRRGEEEQVRTFNMEDAKTANLLNKAGPWTTNPKRMRQMRARSFALRDVFTDVLKGIPIAEEVMDYQEKDITPAKQHAQKITQLTDGLTPEQLQNIRTAIEFAGMTEDQFCTHKKINVTSLEQFPQARFEGAMNYLQSLVQAEPEEGAA